MATVSKENLVPRGRWVQLDPLDQKDQPDLQGPWGQLGPKVLKEQWVLPDSQDHKDRKELRDLQDHRERKELRDRRDHRDRQDQLAQVVRLIVLSSILSGAIINTLAVARPAKS